MELELIGISCPFCGNDLYKGFDICPVCGHDIPKELLVEVGSKTENVLLTHFDGLDEDSKSKIGTFERLYRDTFYGNTSFGFETLDYAPLVTPLMSVVEREACYSIYAKLLPYWRWVSKQKGMQLAKPDKCTLGGLSTLWDASLTIKESTRQDLTDQKKWLDNFGEKARKTLKGTFLGIRNDADHKTAIDRKRFEEFFVIYRDFYETYMPKMIELKKEPDPFSLSANQSSAAIQHFASLRNQFPTWE